jgi:hypothetical protein
MRVILLWDTLTLEAMFIDSSDFESWMRRIMERFDSLEHLQIRTHVSEGLHPHSRQTTPYVPLF